MPIANLKEIQQFGHLEFIARQVVEGFITGLHKSPYHGFSVEFAEHRLYNTGESTKHIDWKLFARSEKLFVKRYEEETNLRCHIVIDNSSSMYFPEVKEVSVNKLNKISFAVYSAASLIYLLRKQRDAFGLTLFSDEIEFELQARSTQAHNKLLYAQLDKLLTTAPTKKEKKSFITSTLHQIADNIHKRSLVVIFSDMMDNSERQQDIFSALQHLRHNKHEVILFHITDKQKELDFNFENRPYRFIDLETNEEVKVNPNEIKEQYLRSIHEYKNTLKLKCGQYQVDLVEADINKGFKDVLLPYLLKRERMH